VNPHRKIHHFERKKKKTHTQTNTHHHTQNRKKHTPKKQQTTQNTHKKNKNTRLFFVHCFLGEGRWGPEGKREMRERKKKEEEGRREGRDNGSWGGKIPWVGGVFVVCCLVWRVFGGGGVCTSTKQSR